MIAILLLAAGASSRMRGRDKLREIIDGESLLRRMCKRALAADLGPVFVSLPSADHPRVDSLSGLAVTQVFVPDADQGMSASIRAAITTLTPVIQAVMIIPADMPELTAQDLCTLAKAHRHGRITRGASDGTPGHPVLFPADLFPDLQKLQGDQGARPVIAAHSDRLHLVSLPERHALTDLDTPEAWIDWRASR